MTVFHLGALGLVQIRPKRLIRLGIDERNTCIATRYSGLVGEMSSSRQLTVWHDPDARAAVKAQNQVCLPGTLRKIEAAPLVQLQNGRVFELGKSRAVLHINGVCID